MMYLCKLRKFGCLDLASDARHHSNGAFNFSKATLPLLLQAVEEKSTYPPTLIFTGATASVKANALMASFSAAKYAERALSSALAKEFGPKGVHVSHAVIDGLIDIPKSKHLMADAGEDAKISPDAVRSRILHTHDTADNFRLLMRTGTCIRNRDQHSYGKLTSVHTLRSGKRAHHAGMELQIHGDCVATILNA